MRQGARTACAAIAELFRRYCWIGCTGWVIFVLIALVRTHPRRFGSTFSAYLDAAQRLWTGQQVYDPATLGDFLYFPLTLLVYTPFTLLDRVPAAAIALALGAAFFTWACATLTLSLLSADWRSSDAIATAGVVLLINIPAAWFNFKRVQAQVPMTAAMMAACAAIIGSRWRAAADYRGWLLIVAALALGFAWALAMDAVLKPAIVTAIYVWLAWLMALPGGWRALVEGNQPQRSGASDHAVASAVADTGHH